VFQCLFLLTTVGQDRTQIDPPFHIRRIPPNSETEKMFRLIQVIPFEGELSQQVGQFGVARKTACCVCK